MHSKLPRPSKKEKLDNRETRVRKAKQLYTEIRKELADEIRWIGLSWYGQQCCQEAPRNGCSEERPGELEAVR